MENENNDGSTISYKQLGLLILVFVLGLITTLLLQNTKTDIQTIFTTTELIGFVLSVILSGASIVLAVSAISLGKSSEQAVIKRSDESIRLQNEVFIRTTEALQRIEASTGVTEKRIEDIISGRVGDISHSIAELTSKSKRGLALNQDELEKEIRQSILSGVREKLSPEEEEKRKKEIHEKRKRYQEFHQLTLSSFSNRNDTKSVKLGHGRVGGKGEDLFDGIFTVNGQKIGLSAFERGDSSNVNRLEGYFSEVAKCLLDKAIQQVVLVFDGDTSDQTKITDTIAELLELYRENPAAYIKVVVAPPEEVTTALSELII
jgi:hypothetical protein